MTVKTDLLTPTARLVGGSLYKPKTTDMDGKPLVVKTGPNAGQPREAFDFAVAIPKGVDPATGQYRHWAHEAWGQKIWGVGAQAFPNGQFQHPTFAWKITDGDSTIPNKRQNKPCDNPGYPGHWVLWFSSGMAPRIYNADGSQQILEPGAVKCGYYVQVFGSVTDNIPSQSPGVYLNHSMVSFQAYGEEIQQGPDAGSVGFGNGGQLPAGASATPLSGQFNPAAPPGTAAAAPIPPTPAYSPPAPGPTAATYTAPAPAVPVAVPPNPAILGMGALAAPPAAMAPPPPPPPAPPVASVGGAPAGYAMTPAAGAHSFAALVAQGWTVDTLVSNGYMVKTA